MSSPKAIIIVEDKNDEYVYASIIRHLALHGQIAVTTDGPDWPDWQAISAESNPDKPNALINGLAGLKNDFSRLKYDRVGIIRDIDQMPISDRLRLVNTAIQQAYGGGSQMTETWEPVEVWVPQESRPEDSPLAIQCHCLFVGVDGQGEIEDVLKKIARQPAPVADCVHKSLPDCLKKNGDGPLGDKGLVKLWINHYQRYDTLKKRNRTEEFTSTKNVMEKRAAELYDYDHSLPDLLRIKKFLKTLVAR